MTPAVSGHHPRGMDATPAAARDAPSPARRSAVGDVRRARAWAVAVLGAATLVALVDGVRALGMLATVPLLAPVLLVGWCVGLATLAVLVRRPSLGPCAAGLAAGSVGAAAGWSARLLTDAS